MSKIFYFAKTLLFGLIKCIIAVLMLVEFNTILFPILFFLSHVSADIH